MAKIVDSAELCSKLSLKSLLITPSQNCLQSFRNSLKFQVEIIKQQPFNKTNIEAYDLPKNIFFIILIGEAYIPANILISRCFFLDELISNGSAVFKANFLR